MRAVTRIDDGRTALTFGGPLRQLCGYPEAVADDQRVGADRAQGQGGVAQRLPPWPPRNRAEALTLMTSALIHLPATSKETLVRVEFS